MPSAISEFIGELLQEENEGYQITDHRVLNAKNAVFATPRRPWPTPVQNLLNHRKITLFSHQALATDHIRAGHSVVVATPTASGKSLIYNLPVLEEILLDSESHALYLFPLKALAQDQLQTLNDLVSPWPISSRPTAALYDGDTPENERKRIRNEPPHVLITNPEMLHLGILPYNGRWTTFLSSLRFIIVDEAHTYRGVFGSNMAHVFRRLNRIIERFGQPPIYVLCTATVGNPSELANALTNVTPAPVAITESGAPQGPRHFLFLNPTILAPSSVAISLLRRALQHGLRTIVYCRSRKMTELISIWAGRNAPAAIKKRISAYRAGYLPEERRTIEAQMASGELLCIISTSALELGIDIGGLDVCILVGYPGSVMSTMQRGGRVGRALQESAVLLVAGEDALDQYFVHNPDDFFTRPAEKAVLNPDNEIIAARHLECAAQELALDVEEEWLKSKGIKKALHWLCAQNRLLPSPDGRSLYTNRKYPQKDISLRGSGQTCIIQDTAGHTIGLIDGFRAWKEAHPGAVYLHKGTSFVIQELDLARGRIVAEPQKVSWFTRTRGQKSTVILEETCRQSLGRSVVCLGRLRITDLVTAYEKRTNDGNRLLAVYPLKAPPQVFETEGLWYIIPNELRQTLESQFYHFMGSIHAMEHAMIGLLPLQVMADRNDFGGISIPLHPQIGLACIFIYDGVPGGAGLTREAYPCAKELLQTTLQLVSNCPCEDGCPSCVHSPKCGSGNRPISKIGCTRLLEEMLSAGNEGDILAKELVLQEAKHLEKDLSLTDLPNDSQETTAQREVAQALNHHITHQKAQPLAEEPLPQIPERYVVFDVETRRSAKEVGGWHRADRMGVSVTVAYVSWLDSFERFEQHELAKLFARFSDAHLIIGFNSLRFDYKVLQPFTEMDLYQLPSLDLLERITQALHYRLSLETLAKATLGAGKTSSGTQALAWWKEGKIEEIAKYCQMDVALTRDLYLFGLTHGALFFYNKAGSKVQFPVSFATPSQTRS